MRKPQRKDYETDDLYQEAMDRYDQELIDAREEAKLERRSNGKDR